MASERASRKRGAVVAAREQDPVEALAAAKIASRRHLSSTGPRNGDKRPDLLRPATVRVLCFIGVLLLIPAAWAVLLLAGAAVWHHERQDAIAMASVMLVCGPIACAMFGGAWHYRAKPRGRRPGT